jgi:hypothetical protein
MDSVASAELATIPEADGCRTASEAIGARATTLDTTALQMALVECAAADRSANPRKAWTVRVIPTLVALLLISPLRSDANEGGWQGWAFERRSGDKAWFIGTWTHGECEEVRRLALTEQLRLGKGHFGVCHPVTLTDEPIGTAVWVILTGDDGFVASRTRDICEDDPTESEQLVRLVAFDGAACLRLWFKVPT